MIHRENRRKIRSVVVKVYKLSNLHRSDKMRSDRLYLLLNAIHPISTCVSTMIIGDSNSHEVRGAHIHPSNVKVLSAGGLCIPAAVDALKKYRRTHTNICQLVWSIGLNDALHGQHQHHSKDYPDYVELLYSESMRIFPNAKMHFILPFTGIAAVTPEFIYDMTYLLQSRTPSVKILTPPCMTRRISRDQVHLNDMGVKEYVQFLSYKFGRY